MLNSSHFEICYIPQQMTNVLKVYIKSYRKSYRQRVKSLFEQAQCAIFHGLQLGS